MPFLDGISAPMQTIQLPASFPGDLDLVAINQQLREGTAQLDWSLFEKGTDQELVILLTGLDMTEDEEVLGVNTMSQRTINRVLNVLKQNPQNPTPEKTKSKRKKQKPEPEITKLFSENLVPATSQTPSGQTQLFKTEYTPNPSLQTEISPEQNDLSDAFSTLKKATPFELREKLVDMIFRDLLGPAGGEYEEINESSLTERYLVGAIAPLIRHQKSTNSDETDLAQEEDPALQDDLAITDKTSSEEGNSENQAPSSSLFPSSFGLTFCVEAKETALTVTARWGQYQKGESSNYLTDAGNPKKVWQRTPISGKKILTLGKPEKEEKIVHPDFPEVVISFKSRRLPNQDWIVTVFLENRQTEPAENKDTAWLFQPELEITSAEPNRPDVFIRKPLPLSPKLDDAIRFEQEAIGLLYRNRLEFAVGHNVSVHAEVKPHQPHRAVSLATCMIPRHEVPQTTPPDTTEIPALKGLMLDMKVLARVEAEALPPLLYPLVQAYEEWITEQESSCVELPEAPVNYRQTGQRNLDDCRQSLQRIRAGIELLEQNEQAIAAFQFMNAAMVSQRVRSLYTEQVRRGKKVTLEELDHEKNHSWRTFQLAFILLNLSGLTDLNHSDRSVNSNKGLCDLLWFPTGGGKTEAYLGLTAYTLAIRRLQGTVAGHDGEHGVAVLMRYTLRLLTLQQFQRATTLICACEDLRRQNPQHWGKEPFRIGLWVGNKNTPNRTKQSEEWVNQAKGQSYAGNSGSPHQLTNCPWCGTEIREGHDIEVQSFEKDRGRTLIYCGDTLGRCLFSRRKSPNEGLPILVVDEEIYRRLPALLIATVDKFAQMPWNGATQMLFGKVNGYCERHGFRCPDLSDEDSHKQTSKLPSARTRSHLPLRPPDLIIQDELHLISGPLGSLVGLYETAVDYLCTWEVNGQKVRPKIIASTATIRQARNQVYNLFLRGLQIFPPQALDIEDNFFSRQRAPNSETPGRLYLGICAPGRRLKAAVIRVYLAALASAQQLFQDYGQEADPWMTLVGYFNSLRELGGTRRLVDDDITTRLSKMDERGLARRRLKNIEELTSRKSSTDIPKILDALEQIFEPASVSKESQKKGERRRKPLDIVLATNMISVGVDVSRLGLMVACGQPKNTAEYIQSTSRVGRKHPGLVLTVYNWARPRDLSHYERFEHYHSTFYQHVEPLSVTPYSSGAIERGAAALLVALIRLAGVDFNRNEDAEQLKAEILNNSHVLDCLDAIARRCEELTDAPKGQELRQRLEALKDHWLKAAIPREGGTKLTYHAFPATGTNIPLLKAIEKYPSDPFACLNSLRNVEAATPLILNTIPPENEVERVPQPFTSFLDH